MIDTVEALEALYGTPSDAALQKVVHRMTPLYRRWIMASRFCILSTVGNAGTDASPRGDDGPVVQELDPATLALPDWRGNNRLDSFRNIVEDGRVSLMFMVPGCNDVIRVNGQAGLTVDENLRARFEQKSRVPKLVIIIQIREIYAQCARALMRSDLWAQTDRPDVPSFGAILREITDGGFDGAAYDTAWPERAAKTLW